MLFQVVSGKTHFSVCERAQVSRRERWDCMDCRQMTSCMHTLPILEQYQFINIRMKLRKNLCVLTCNYVQIAIARNFSATDPTDTSACSLQTKQGTYVWKIEMVHSSTCFSGPWQGLPPCCGAGLLQVRERCFFKVASQVLQELQQLQRPSTLSVKFISDTLSIFL